MNYGLCLLDEALLIHYKAD